MPSCTPEVQRSSAVGRSPQGAHDPVADAEVVLDDLELGDLGRGVGRGIDHAVRAGDPDRLTVGVDLGCCSRHAGQSNGRLTPVAAVLSSITEFGENTERPSSVSGVGRMYSNPEVVTTAHASGGDGMAQGRARVLRPQLQRRLSARDVRGREVERVPVGLLDTAEEGHRTREALAAHPADAAERALGDLAPVQTEVAHAGERDVTDPARWHVDHADAFDVHPPVSVRRDRALVVADDDRAGPRGSRGSRGGPAW